MYNNGNNRDFNQEIKKNKMARYTVLSGINNIDTNWSAFVTLLRDLEHRFIPKKNNQHEWKKKKHFPN